MSIVQSVDDKLTFLTMWSIILLDPSMIKDNDEDNDEDADYF